MNWRSPMKTNHWPATKTCIFQPFPLYHYEQQRWMNDYSPIAYKSSNTRLINDNFK
jgi:hypothetical protein